MKYMMIPKRSSREKIINGNKPETKKLLIQDATNTKQFPNPNNGINHAIPISGFLYFAKIKERTLIV